MYCNKCNSDVFDATNCANFECGLRFSPFFPRIINPPFTNILIPEKEAVDHPDHYGGKDNPYEAIKVIEAWNLGFNLGNTVKYISRAGKKDALVQDLEKAKWYLEREISKLKGGNND